MVRLILMESLYLKSARAAEGLKDRLPAQVEEAPPVHLPPPEEGSAQPDLEQGVGVWCREVERRVLRAEGTAWADSGHSARGASFLAQVSAQMLPPQRGLLLPPREGACHQSSFLSSSHLGPSPE